MTTSLRDGQFTLISLTMSVSGKAVDLSRIAVRADVYENILLPGIFLELTLNDSIGLFTATLHQDEEICLSFSTYEGSAPIHYRFRIMEVNPAKQTPDNKSVVYVITAASDEFVKATDIKYASPEYAYQRKKVEPQRAVGGMLEILGSTKTLFYERTLGKRTETSAGLWPFQFIKNVVDRAKSEKWSGGAFVFFENNKGYHFKTLQTLIEEGVRNIGDKFFIHSTLANADTTSAGWRNIIAYKMIQKGNLTAAQMSGAFNKRVVGVDRKTGKQIEYRNKPGGAENPTMNPGAISLSAEAVNERGTEEGKVELVFIDSGEDGEWELEKKAALPAFLAQFFNVLAHITIYGDTTITVGDVIQCRIPKPTGLSTEEKAEEDSTASGNYMVMKCRHILTFGDSPLYFQALEIAKDGIGTVTGPTKTTLAAYAGTMA